MLIGLRETDDQIVSATFSSLAVLVPILGASVVVGGERKKYFIEGRPKVGLHLKFPQQPNLEFERLCCYDFPASEMFPPFVINFAL